MGAIQEIRLPDGTVVHARLSASDAYGGDDQDIGVLDGAVAKVEQLGELVRGVGQSVLDAARAARPDNATITFGVELTAKSGGALAVLASGEAKASIQVTLGWSFAGDGESTSNTNNAETSGASTGSA
ncbi:CU044_2847 family protein [Streptomyces sp. HUAS MG91]|uniref:CU044_2847 family protein n=1 Tax=Streptomyces tabacisoli TaxID=3156398 RepID=A0AAU8IY78_9ACTN